MNHEYRMQRGRMLKMLYRAYEKSLSLESMVSFLYAIGLGEPLGVMKAHVAYLKDRELIREEETTSRIGSVVKWRLTSKGVDFVEMDTSDDGIELGV